MMINVRYFDGYTLIYPLYIIGSCTYLLDVRKANKYISPQRYLSASKMRPKESKDIVLLIQHTPSRNLGSKALLYAVIDLINKAFHPKKIAVWSWFPKYDEAQSTLPANTEILPSPARTISSWFEGIVILSDMFLFFIWALCYRFTKRDISRFLLTERRRMVICPLKNTNIVVARGGDGVLTDFDGFRAFLASFYNFLLPLILNKKVILPSLTIPPFKRKITMKLTSFILKRADYIIARDMHTKKLLRELGVTESRIAFMPDAAFTLLPREVLLPESITKTSEKLLIGLVPSAYAYKHFEEGLKEGDQYIKYTDLFAKVIDYVVEKYGAKVLLIPHEFSTYEPSRIDDKKVARDVYKKLKYKTKVEIIEENDPRTVKFIISKLDFLISPRMHPLVHALSTGVPIIGIDHGTLKTIELMNLFGIGNFTIKIKNLDTLTLKNKIDLLVPQLSKISQNIVVVRNNIVKRKRYINLLQQCPT